MNRKKLTQTTVNKAEYEGQNNERYIVWDTNIQGFGLRVYPSGRKAYVLSYRHHGRKRLMTIATHGVETLSQAQSKAKIELGKVSADTDPLAQKQKNAQGDTVKDLCAAYMERHAKIKKKSWTDDQAMIDNWITPAWGALKAKAITRDDVAALHRKVGAKINPKTEKPMQTSANRVLALISKMWELAELWGYVEEGKPNPTRKIERFKEVKRDRYVKHDEFPLLAKSIKGESNKTAQAALWLYLLTGLRKSELLSLEWSSVDLDRQELRLADTKAGRVHYLPLSAPAVDILSSIPRIVGNPYVLTGKLSGKHLVNIDKPWRRVRKAAGLEDVTLHDLRRTVGSWLAQDGSSLPLIGKVLNHSNSSTTQIYARFADDSGRKALEKHGEAILDAAGLRATAQGASKP